MMRAALFRRVLPLRIDVDFRAGLLRAVPSMLDALAARDMHATFFVVAGRNRPRRSLGRLRESAYRKRFARLGPLRVWSALRGDNAPMLEGPEAQRIVRRIESEGHELAVHGWDHGAWADRVWHASLGELVEDVERAYDAITKVAGPRKRAWGSPNWRSRQDVIATLVERGVDYLSECWGRAPFLSHGCLHLPVTDNLEARVFDAEPEPIESLLGAAEPEAYRLICMHDYFEGLLYPQLFPRLLDALGRRGLRATSLSGVARELDRSSLIEETLDNGPVEGFCGDVSWQSSQTTRVLSSATL